jgi:ABC-2 type transport system ATP-binding protein
MARRAKLYLLDEPIAGVDPAARDYILRTIIGNYNKNASVIMTTHLIHDIEPVLDEFAFMGYGGQILLSGEADDVRAAHGKSLDQLFREVFRC